MVDLTIKGPMGLNGMTATTAAALLETGKITSEALVRDCLARIQAREGEVQAWDYLDSELVIAQAKALDATPRRSPLHGIPVGIKDIFDTKDMPTGHGFGPYKGYHGGCDSACVAVLRAAGMVIMGKTTTTEFACPLPRRTTNPHDPTRTPGVSSSGSAAAVADFMVPLANGTQTGGSVIGPAANCGVYAYKASLDGIDRTGLRHCKPSIDTIGLFARSIEDLILMRSVQTGTVVKNNRPVDGAPRIGILRTAHWDTAEHCMQTAIERAASLLSRAGATVSDVTLPPLFVDIEPDFAIVNGWEGTMVLEAEIKNYFDSFNDHNRERVNFAQGLNVQDYEAAGKRLEAARAAMDAQFGECDLFISPSLAGEAPVGLTEVRRAVFARLWTQMYTPTVNLPLFIGPHSMPVCVQIIGPRNTDDITLAGARWVDTHLREALGGVPAAV